MKTQAYKILINLFTRWNLLRLMILVISTILVAYLTSEITRKNYVQKTNAQIPKPVVYQPFRTVNKKIDFNCEMISDLDKKTLNIDNISSNEVNNNIKECITVSNQNDLKVTSSIYYSLDSQNIFQPQANIIVDKNINYLVYNHGVYANNQIVIDNKVSSCVVSTFYGVHIVVDTTSIDEKDSNIKPNNCDRSIFLATFIVQKILIPQTI